MALHFVAGGLWGLRLQGLAVLLTIVSGQWYWAVCVKVTQPLGIDNCSYRPTMIHIQMPTAQAVLCRSGYLPSPTGNLLHANGVVFTIKQQAIGLD